MTEQGYNTDVTVQGLTYHVQTEDWGMNHRFVVTRVFRSGAVLKTYKTSYLDLLQKGPASDRQAIRLAMQEQHQAILDLLVAGQL
jgi:hypothetical protein